MRLLVLPVLALLSQPARAGVAGRTLYEDAVDRIDRLYLYPDQIDASKLLKAAANGLAAEVPWLLARADGAAVDLVHGSEGAIGSVTSDSMHTLPLALASLESLVVDSGHPVGTVDVRLAILKGMTNALDRYSTVLTGDRLERFDVRLKGTLVGVGATLRLEEDGRLRVRELVPGGPAELGGLRVGDTVLRIGGVSTVNMPLREATRRIRGEIGTKVGVTVSRARPGGRDTLTLSLLRDEVVVSNVEHALDGDGIGYLKIDHFSQRTVENLRGAIADLRAKGGLSRGLILDLRGNTGGSMKQAAEAANLFVLNGLLLRTAGPDGGKVEQLQHRIDAEDLVDDDGVDFEEPMVPLVVLVDGKTASGSEILAGSLLELGRAALVGTRTYGKGTVQKIYTLEEGARLKLTVAQFMLANDRTIAGDGIVPDVVMADVHLDAQGVEFQRWSRNQTGVDWEEVLPVVWEDPSWRGVTRTPGDVERELAHAALLRAAGPGRKAIRDAVIEAAAVLRRSQESYLVEALDGRGIDWSPAPRVAGAPEVDITVRATPDRARPEVQWVRVELHNRGPEPLHRALVELDCETFPQWSGLAIPVGRVLPGERGRGEIAVPLDAGIEAREDIVRARVRSDRRPPLTIGDEVLTVSSPPRPVLVVAGRLVGEGPTRTAELRVQNASEVAIDGLEVHFSHPGDLDVELIDRAARTAYIAPGKTARLDLTLALGRGAPPVLPLELVVSSDNFGRLAGWPLALPTHGGRVRLEAPTVEALRRPTAAPVGELVLPLVVSDDTALHHVTVYANGQKVSYVAGSGPTLDVRAPIYLQAGLNRVVVLAEDEQGVRTRRAYVVRGEVLSSVDADEDASPPEP